MDFLFVLAAVCPAIAMAGHELKEENSWRQFLVKFAEWFYGITVVDFFVLYMRGWGSFTFRDLTVQFLMKYMVMSIAAIILILSGKRVMKVIFREER